MAAIGRRIHKRRCYNPLPDIVVGNAGQFANCQDALIFHSMAKLSGCACSSLYQSGNHTGSPIKNNLMDIAMKPRKIRYDLFRILALDLDSPISLIKPNKCCSI